MKTERGRFQLKHDALLPRALAPAQNVSFAVLSVDRRPAIRLILLALLALEATYTRTRPSATP